MQQARVSPNYELIIELTWGVCDACDSYGKYLDDNDIDDIDELADLLNIYTDDLFPIKFTVSDDVRNPTEWFSAIADWNPTEGNTIQIILYRKNLEGVYDPETFKLTLVGALGHETIHFGQYDKIGAERMNKIQSGHQKGLLKVLNGGSGRDWKRSYLRDPHEIMAYGHDLAREIHGVDKPQNALRNPEAYRDELLVWDMFREIFPANAKQMKQLLKYTADYFNSPC